MGLSWIAKLAAILPLVTICVTFIIAASNEHIPWCIPLIEGCSSISATGRKLPEAMVFKGLMIPSAIVIALFWLLTGQWLKLLQPMAARRINAIVWVGCIALIFLVAYTTALGYVDQQYRVVRQNGALFFFCFTLVAQIMTLNFLWKNKQVFASDRCIKLLKILTGIVVLTWLIALSSLLRYTMKDNYVFDNVVEWNFVVVTCSFYLVCARLWQYTKLARQSL